MFEYDTLRMTVLKTDNHHVTQVKIENLSDLTPSPATALIKEEA